MMVEYQSGSHTLHDIKYHLVWITKYRYHVLRGEVAERARDVIREICMAREVQIIRGSLAPDHVHMLVSCPPLRLSWCSRSRGARRVSCSKNSPNYAGALSPLPAGTPSGGFSRKSTFSRNSNLPALAGSGLVPCAWFNPTAFRR